MRLRVNGGYRDAADYVSDNEINMSTFFDPLETKIKQAIQAATASIKLAILISLDREAARVILSRLATLDPDRSADYLAAIKNVGEGD